MQFLEHRGGLLGSVPRIIVWALFGMAWIGGMWLWARLGSGLRAGATATDSLVDRFGTFTIIVLGEVVIGVVGGLAATERDAQAVAVGLLAPWIGFDFSWIYFDLVGRGLPRTTGGALTNWALSHFPIPISVTAVAPGAAPRSGPVGALGLRGAALSARGCIGRCPAAD